MPLQQFSDQLRGSKQGFKHKRGDPNEKLSPNLITRSGLGRQGRRRRRMMMRRRRLGPAAAMIASYPAQNPPATTAPAPCPLTDIAARSWVGGVWS